MDITTAIAAERRELATMLDGLPAGKWDAPTLCAGWRVREVAAHMTMGFRYSLPRMAAELITARGNLNRMTDRCARKDAATFSTGELAAFLRDNAGHPWKPPVGGITAALGHDVVHGLDITVALGLGRRVPDDRVRTLLDSVNAKTLTFFGADIDGVELRADDLDLVLRHRNAAVRCRAGSPAGRLRPEAPPGRLRGEPCDRFVTA